jgi:replication factor C small subunit
MKKLISEILRPSNLNDLVIRQEIRDRLQRMIEHADIMNMLFHGKPGCGKTSAALIFANSGKFDTLRIDGSVNTGIDEMRRIENYGSTVSLTDHQKIVMLDEADHLSKQAQAALRGLVEKLSSNCRFIFTANRVDKIDIALQSRLLSVCFDMTPNQVKIELEKQTERIVQELQKRLQDPNIDRIKQIISVGFPDYRAIANRLQFEFF